MKSYLRFLSRNKLYTAIEVVGLSVSLAFVVLMNSYVISNTSYDKEIKNKGDIYICHNKNCAYSFTFLDKEFDKYPEIIDYCQLFHATNTVKVNGENVNAAQLVVSDNFFEFLPYKLKYGNPEDVFAASNSAVISESFASRIFPGEDPIGRTIEYITTQDISIKLTVTGIFKDVRLTHFMDKDVIEKVRSCEAVEVASPQFYLASLNAECCGDSVPIIGFEPETDFTVQPWISEQYSKGLNHGEVIIGDDINVEEDGTILFFGKNYKVASRLERTGSGGVDVSCFVTMDTIADLYADAKEKGAYFKEGVTYENSVSSIMVRVKEGYTLNQAMVQIRKATEGSITINGVGSEATYEIYQLLVLESYNQTSGAYSYKANAAWEAFFATPEAEAYMSTDADGYVTWATAEDDDTKAAFAKLALAYAKANNIDISAVVL